MLLQKKNKNIHPSNFRNIKAAILFSVLLLLLVLLLAACTEKPVKYSNNHVNQMNSETSKELFKVVIDPGHGGRDNGATGASGQYEKEFTLGLSKKVEKLLRQEQDIQVFMTRKGDRYISQESRYRPKYANKLRADLFISIHGNTFSDPEVTGTETFYYHKGSQNFADILHKYVVEATGFRDRGVKKQDLFVVKDTKMPAALIEIGYLTNPQDESKMWLDEFQSRVASSIVEGIKEYKALTEK